MEGDIIKPNPDNRRDNVRKIQKHINHTIQNMELAEEMIAETDDPNTREALIEKNKRRERALGFRKKYRRGRARKKDKDNKDEIQHKGANTRFPYRVPTWSTRTHQQICSSGT